MVSGACGEGKGHLDGKVIRRDADETVVKEADRVDVKAFRDEGHVVPARASSLFLAGECWPVVFKRLRG